MIIYRFKYNDYHLKTKLFRCLTNTPRLYILEILRDEEKTTSEIVQETKHNQSNGSNHLNCLLDCCFVKCSREGNSIFYNLNNKNMAKLLQENNPIPSKIVIGLYLCINYDEK